MKIGDEVYIHGYVDEIRNDAIIIRNKVGYFGTVPEEIVPSAQPKRKKGKWVVINEFDDCCYAKCNQCNVTQIFYYGKPLTNYCPNCGSHNGDEEDE